MFKLHVVLLASCLAAAVACSDSTARPVGSSDTSAPSGSAAAPTQAQSAFGEAAVKKLAEVGLTLREQSDLSRQLAQVGSPCQEPITLAQCIAEDRACKPCVPAGKYLAKLVRLGVPEKDRAKIYEGRFDPKAKKNIDLGDSPSKGPDDAVVTIVEWADFECPGCLGVKPALDLMIERFPGQVRLVYKHFPLVRNHPHAMGAAQAAVAAQNQGKFWEMHAALFDATATQKGLAPQDLSRIAKRRVGLEMEQFRKDFSSDETQKRIRADMDQAETLGLDGTPFIWVNGRLLQVADPFWENFEEWVRLEIELAGKEPAKPSEKYDALARELGLEAPAPSASGSAGPAPATSASAGAPPVPSGSAAPAPGAPPKK